MSDHYLWFMDQEKRWCIGEEGSIGTAKCALASYYTSKLPWKYSGKWSGVVKTKSKKPEDKWKDLEDVTVYRSVVFKPDDRVRVRDKDQEWKIGTVTQGGAKPYVQLDGREDGSRWDETEYLDGRDQNWKKKTKQCWDERDERMKQCWNHNVGNMKNYDCFRSAKNHATFKFEPETDSQGLKQKPIGIKLSRTTVTKVETDSQAEKLGVKEGWMVLEVNGKKIPETEKVLHRINKTAKHEKPTVILFQKYKSGGKFVKGDKVHVRDKPGDAWKIGTVTRGGEDPTVLIEGWHNGHEFKQVQHLGPPVQRLVRKMEYCATQKIDQCKKLTPGLWAKKALVSDVLEMKSQNNWVEKDCKLYDTLFTYCDLSEGSNVEEISLEDIIKLSEVGDKEFQLTMKGGKYTIFHAKKQKIYTKWIKAFQAHFKNTEEFIEGTELVLYGLKKEEYNGELCTVVKYNREDERYAVRLSAPEFSDKKGLLSVRVKNLKRQGTAESEKSTFLNKCVSPCWKPKDIS